MASLALFVISSTLTQGFYDFNGGGYGSGYDIGFGKGFGYDKSYPSYNDPKKKDCSRVSCYKPACDEYYEELYVPYGECCPKCRPKDNGKGYSDKDKYYQDSYGCDYTKCYEPKCRSNQELYTPKGECCPQCKNKRNINTYGVGFGFDRGLYNGVDTVDVGFNSGVDTLFGQKARKDPKKDSGYDKYDPKFTPTKKDPKYTKKYEPKYSDVNKGFGKGYDVGFKGKKDPKYDIGYDKYDPKYNKKHEPKKYDIYSGIDKDFGKGYDFGKKDPKYDVGYGKKDKTYDAYSGVGKGFGKGYDIGKKDPKYDVYSDFGGGFGKGFGKGYDFGFGKKKLATITEIVNKDKELSTLATALKLAGLDEALNGEGPFTLFAPTNDAFEALGDVLDTVINDIDLLTDILLYHVLNGAVFSGDLSDGLIAETLLGQEIEFEINGGVFILTTSAGKSEIIDVDIDAKNGVIHKINLVLVPKLDNGKDYSNKGYKDRGYKNRGYKNRGSNKFGKGYDKYNPRGFGGGKVVRFGFDKDTSTFDVFGGKIDRNDKKGKGFDKKDFGQVRYKSDTEDDKLIKDDKKFDLPKPKFDPKFDSKSIGGVSKVGKKLDNKFTKKFDPKLDSKSIKGIGLDKKFDLELDPKFDPKFGNKGKKYDPYGYDPKYDNKKSPKHDPYGYEPKYDPKFGAPKTPKFDPYGYDPKYGNVKTDTYDPKYDPKYAGYGNGDNRGYNGKNDYSFDPKGHDKQVKQPKSKAKKDDVFNKDFNSRNKDLMGEYNVFDGFQQNIKKIDNDLFQSPFKTKKDK